MRRGPVCSDPRARPEEPRQGSQARLDQLHQHLGEVAPSPEEILLFVFTSLSASNYNPGDSHWSQDDKWGVTTAQTKGDRVRVTGSDMEGGPGQRQQRRSGRRSQGWVGALPGAR